MVKVVLKPQQGIKVGSSNKYLFDPAISQAYDDLAKDWATKTDGLVDEEDYSSKAYAIGGTGTETNNSKYYSEQAATSATNASTSETNAGISATTASTQAGIATNKANDASASATTATTQAGIAIAKAGEASTSATNAGISETNAGNSATAASNSANSASASASLAHDWATSNTIVESGQYGARYYSTQAYNANLTAQAAKDLAKDWANKTDGTVDGSEYSSKYYAGHSKVWAEGTDVEVQALGGIHSAKGWVSTLGNVYKPAGSVAFASLPTLDADHLGFVYNVTDSFTTTSDFVEGAGKDYPAGTNVVCIDVNGDYKWDILGSFVDLSGYQPLLVSGTNIKTINSNSILGSGNLDIDALPSQTGQSGKFLTTDGTDASWANVDALPSQTGQSGKYLTTDGTSASWGSVTIPTVNNATLTITQGGTTKGTFTANASSDVTIDLDSGGASRNIGEVVQSTIPLTDAGLHLLDGSLISSGSYDDFVTYIAGLVSTYPDLFATEASWQSSVSTYGVCGKFVYDSVNGTVRLPKITGFTESTIDPTVLGDLVQAGLPNHKHYEFANETGSASDSGVYLTTTQQVAASTNTGGWGSAVNSPSNSAASVGLSGEAINSSIYGNSSTVQPQSIKVLYYIVIATSTKTSIEVDIDEIATDLNGKADVDLSNAIPAISFATVMNTAGIRTVVETYVNGTSWYRVYSDNWCEQGGRAAVGANSVTFAKQFANTNYSIRAERIDLSSTFHTIVGNLATTGFDLREGQYGTYPQSLTSPASWQACGYIS